MHVTPEEYMNRRISERFNRLQRRGSWHKRWSKLVGNSSQLVSLHEVEAQIKINGRNNIGNHIVPLHQIKGSVNRSRDFDKEFRPLRHHSCQRWIDIALMLEFGKTLPAVELVKIGDAYFVADGHHRISARRANGQLEIDANIVELHTKDVIDWSAFDTGTSLSQHLQRRVQGIGAPLARQLRVTLGNLLVAGGSWIQKVSAPTPA